MPRNNSAQRRHARRLVALENRRLTTASLRRQLSDRRAISKFKDSSHKQQVADRIVLLEAFLATSLRDQARLEALVSHQLSSICYV